MSESATAVKLLAVLAVVTLLANTMGLGPSEPFQTMQNALSNGPQLPTFQDPFTLKSYVGHVGVPVANATTGFPQESWLTGCTLSNYSDCMASADGDESFISVPLDQFFSIVFTPGPVMPDDVRVVRIDVEWQVRTIYDNMSVSAFGTNEKVTPITNPLGEFSDISYSRIPASPLDNWTAWENGSSSLHVLFGEAGGSVDISFARYTLYAAGVPACTAPPGAWFPWLDEVACSIGQGLDWLVTLGQFMANAVVFFFTYVGAWGLWFGAVVGGVITGVFGMSLWFLALDAPSEVIGLFAIVIVSILGFFLLMIMRLVRG